MFLFKRTNGIWYIAKQGTGKNRVNKSCKTRSKTEANNKFAEELNKHKMDLSGEIDFDAFESKVISDAKASNFSPNSIVSIHYAFKQLRSIFPGYNLTNPLIGSIKPIHIQDMKIKRSGEVSPATVNIELRTLKGIFSRAVNWGYLAKNPCKGIGDAVEVENEILSMTGDELKSFFSSILNDDHRVIFMTSLHTVCRRNELINLQMKHVLLDEMKIRILNKPTFRTKSKKTREIPISNELRVILQEYINKRFSSGHDNIIPFIDPEAYLFVTDEGKPYSEDSLSQLFRRIRIRAGLPEKYHLHCLRHTGISMMLNVMKMPPTIVRDIAGHARLTTTMKYCHVEFEQKKNAVNGLSYGI